MLHIAKLNKYLKHVVTNLELLQPFSTFSNRHSKSDIKAAQDAKLNSTSLLVASGITEEKKSKAMQAYLDRAQKYNAFMSQQREEYSAGKRHLANMMGKDPESFSEEDVNEAIEYLFPSGLFVPGARPLMKPPEKVYPPKKDAEFDDSGRPFHYLFYTGKPNYFFLLNKYNKHLSDLNDYEDKMIRKRLEPDPNIKMELSGSVWIDKEALQLRLVEQITEREYNNFINLMERIIAHPYVYNIKDSIMEVRNVFMDVKMGFAKPPKPCYDNTGRGYITTTACPRKSARATVTVWYPGTGKIDVNGSDLSYFEDAQSREQILFPLHLSGMLDKVDVEATVDKGGPTGQAGAIRWGIAWGLRSFVDADMIEKMRFAGLLTRDIRHRERKKPGQWKARRKYTWKKR